MKKRILVVEDEEKLRRVIELQLTVAGFDVDKAANADNGGWRVNWKSNSRQARAR